VGTSATTYDVTVDGEVFATGNVTAFGSLSDARFKEDIVDLEGILPRIRALRPVDFRWKSDVYYKPRQGTSDVGFIAQEVEDIFPLLIRKFIPPGVEDELKGVAYEKLTPYIIKALQELDNELQNLRAEFTEFKNNQS
jgi:hypothetical protein